MLTTRELLAEIRLRLEDCYHCEDMPDAALAFELIRGAYREIKDLVEQLMDRCPPHGHLPGEGQPLWRRFQSAVNTLDVRDDSPFFSALDRLYVWFAGIDPDRLHAAPGAAPSPGAGPGPAANGRPRSPGLARKTKDDAEAEQRREEEALRRALGVYHSRSDRKDMPITQRSLASALGWPQARVCRVASRAIPGGWEDYLAAFRTGRPPGFMRAGGVGRGQPDGIVVPDGD
jgi:hypothetical protein